MAKNFVQPGEVLTFAAPSGNIMSGEARMFGSMFGVAQFGAAAGAPVEVATEGVWTLPKAGTPLTFAAGARVFWDDTAKTCKASGSGLFPIGVATVAAGADDATVSVRLDGVASIAVA